MESTANGATGRNGALAMQADRPEPGSATTELGWLRSPVLDRLIRYRDVRYSTFVSEHTDNQQNAADSIMWNSM